MRERFMKKKLKGDNNELQYTHICEEDRIKRGDVVRVK